MIRMCWSRAIRTVAAFPILDIWHRDGPIGWSRLLRIRVLLVGMSRRRPIQTRRASHIVDTQRWDGMIRWRRLPIRVFPELARWAKRPIQTRVTFTPFAQFDQVGTRLQVDERWGVDHGGVGPVDLCWGKQGRET